MKAEYKRVLSISVFDNS